MTVEQIGHLIRIERKRQGLRQDELAAASGVGLRFLVEVEGGKETQRAGRQGSGGSGGLGLHSTYLNAGLTTMTHSLSVWSDDRIVGSLNLNKYGEPEFQHT